jgi:hypothetical protein
MKVLFHHLTQFCDVMVYCCFTRDNDGLETQRRCVLIRSSRMGFPHRELSYRPPQKVKSSCALIFSQRVSDFRLARFPSHVMQYLLITVK